MAIPSADPGPGDRDFFPQDLVHGEAVEILHPVVKPPAVRDRRAGDRFLRLGRGVAGKHRVGLPRADEFRDLLAVTNLHVAPAAERILVARVVRIHRDFAELQRRGIARLPRQIPARRLQRARERMHHLMSPRRQFAAQRDRERMAGIVVNDDSHERGKKEDRRKSE